LVAGIFCQREKPGSKSHQTYQQDKPNAPADHIDPSGPIS